MKRVNVNIYPKNGGYIFKDKDGTVFTGDSWGAVIKRVQAYRKRCDVPLGNPEQDVMAQACDRNPNICIDQDGAAVAVTQAHTRRISLKSLALSWLTAIRNRVTEKDIKYVSVLETQARERVCIGCSHNTEYPSGCSSCKSALKEFRRAILPGRVVNSSRLNACAMLGEDTATSVHLDEHRVHKPELPANCWRKAGV